MAEDKEMTPADLIAILQRHNLKKFSTRDDRYIFYLATDDIAGVRSDLKEAGLTSGVIAMKLAVGICTVDLLRKKRS